MTGPQPGRIERGAGQDVRSGAGDAGLRPERAEHVASPPAIPSAADPVPSVPAPAGTGAATPRPATPRAAGTAPAGTAPTGHPAVDAALAALDGAGHRSAAEQVAAYEAAHRALQQTLATIDQG